MQDTRRNSMSRLAKRIYYIMNEISTVRVCYDKLLSIDVSYPEANLPRDMWGMSDVNVISYPSIVLLDLMQCIKFWECVYE